MAWDCEQTIQGNDRILLPCSFNSRVLAIDISATNQRANWYQSGFLRAILDIDGEPFIGADIQTTFGQQVINLPFASYKIDFAPRVWLNSTTIKIKQLTTTQLGANFMSISFPGAVAPTANVGTPFAVGVAVTSNTVLAANPLRTLGGIIINNSTKNLWVRFDVTAAVTAAPCVSIPPGGNMDIEDGYTGPVTGISEAGATGTINGFQYLTA
jgi:hypothetical protein